MFGLIQGEANAIAPRKTPLSSMTPTIVLSDGKLFMVVGSPGGPTIINTVLQVILNVMDFHMNVQEAVDRPRIHHQWMPDTICHGEDGSRRTPWICCEPEGISCARSPFIGEVAAILFDGVAARRADGRVEATAKGY